MKLGNTSKYIGLLFFLLTLVSCSGKTTVILLAEDDGSVGMVEVKGKQSSQVVDSANSYTVVNASSPSVVKEMSSKEIENRFAEVIKAQPPKPISFLLYFKSDSTELVPKSTTSLPGLFRVIEEKQPCQIIIIGHTDSLGTRSYNIDLSIKRAVSIRKIIENKNHDITRIDVYSYGENDPFIKTKDDVSEPLNRRVEVIIR